MKLRLLILALVCGLVASAQGPSSGLYQPLNQQYNWKAGYFRGLHVPVGGNAALQVGQWTGQGAIYYDSIGVDTGLYVLGSGGIFHRMAYADDLTSAGIDSIWRQPGIDSIFWRKSGITFAIMDSIGSGGQKFGESDTLFTSNRRVSGRGIYSLLLDSLIDFDITDADGNNRFQIGDVRTKLFSASLNAAIELGDTMFFKAPQFHIESLQAATTTEDKTVMVYDTSNTHWQRMAFTPLDTTGKRNNWIIKYDSTNNKFVFRPPFDTTGTGGTLSGSGVSGRGSYWNGTSSLTSSANWTFDGTTHAIANSATAASIIAGNTYLQSLGTNNNVIGFNTYYNSGFKAGVTGRTSGIYGPNGELQFFTSSSNSSAGAAAAWVCRMRIMEGGNIAIGPNVGSITATAYLHLSNGTATASTAPLKFTSGSLLTTAEAGAIEFLTDKFYASITTGAARKEITLNDAALTSGTVPVATTNGRLTDGLIITSNEYTPTTSGATGGTVLSVEKFLYQRVGNYVSFSGYVSIDPTADGSIMEFFITLPIASNFGGDYDASGTLGCVVAGSVGQIQSDATEDKIRVSFVGGTGSTASLGIRVTGHYKII